VRPALEGLHSVPRLRRRHPPARSDRLARRPTRTNAPARTSTPCPLSDSG